MFRTIRSGGQSGVDQAAHRAARRGGLECKGWCPPGRVCEGPSGEEGRIPEEFSFLQETPAGESQHFPGIARSQRTEWNVRDSDGTLIIRPPATAHDQPPDPGTDVTVKAAKLYNKPWWVVHQCDESKIPRELKQIRTWAQENCIRILNVAGPSVKKSPTTGDWAERFLMKLFRSTFLTLCLETASSYSREFSEDEVREIVRLGKLPAVLEHLWEFTGHFYMWPEALLSRPDLPRTTEEVLRRNLRDELGGDAGTPHTVLFSNMARSLGVTLPVPPKQGVFIRQLLSDAVSLDGPRSLGQFLANEATPKWRGFITVLRDRSGAELEFFHVHANEDNHYLSLTDDLSTEELPLFWSGVIEFAKRRAEFMNGLREALSQ